MDESGFDDIEMKNRNMEEEEETSFGGDDLQTASGNNRSINIINTENPKSKFNRVEMLSKLKKKCWKYEKTNNYRYKKKRFEKYLKFVLKIKTDQIIVYC